MMFFPSTSTEYQAHFPPLEKQIDQQKSFVSKPFVPSTITPAGHLEEPRSFEAVLNWQTQNVVAQNQAITTLHHKVDNITQKTNQVEKKVDTISDKLNHIYQIFIIELLNLTLNFGLCLLNESIVLILIKKRS